MVKWLYKGINRKILDKKRINIGKSKRSYSIFEIKG
jgi:hypothetical protein